MENLDPVGLEKIFFELIRERRLEFGTNAKERKFRIESGNPEYEMKADYPNGDPTLNFSSDNIYQLLTIMHVNSNQYMTFHLKENELKTIYFCPEAEGDYPDLENLKMLSEDKDILFFNLLYDKFRSNLAEGLVGISISQDFDYKKTIDLIKVFLDYLNSPILINQSYQQNQIL